MEKHLIFYACDSRSKTSVDILKSLGWGRVFCKETSKPYDGEHWIFDNGAYAAWKNKTDWDADAYLKRLEKQMKLGVPDFGVVPDKVGEGERSLDFSVKWRRKLPNNWKWYLALQDGMIRDIVIPIIDMFDGIFLGGTYRFKVIQGGLFRRFAYEHKKKFHYARASTRHTIHFARCLQVDSIDSAFPFWIKERRNIVEKALIEPIEDLWRPNPITRRGRECLGKN